MDPQAQARHAYPKTATPRRSTGSEPPQCDEPTRSATPAKPRTSPRSTLGTGLCPPGRSQSTMTSQRETMVTNNAVIPEGTICSAQLTPPLPTNSNTQPVTAADFQFAAVGRTRVLQRRMGQRSNPTAK